MMQEIMILLLGAVGILAAALLLTIWKYQKIKKEANQTMQQVDDTLEQLIQGNERNYFSKNEDSLLGKFQTQAGRLYDIHRAHEQREKELRAQMSSTISDLVHQINTPIANIKMYSEFLKEGALTPEEYQHFADNLEQQAEKLSWLGEGFSKVSRLETGIISLKPEVQPILPVLLAAIDQVSLKAQKHENDIQLEGSQTLKARFDRKWTEEVFFNLLDNAVKYSSRRSIILVELWEYEMYICVNICSQGIKIEREEFPKLFQRFYRGKSAKNREGVGLGLYLAREIVREERGYMKGEFDQKKGNVFRVFLPKL